MADIKSLESLNGPSVFQLPELEFRIVLAIGVFMAVMYFYPVIPYTMLCAVQCMCLTGTAVATAISPFNGMYVYDVVWVRKVRACHRWALGFAIVIVEYGISLLQFDNYLFGAPAIGVGLTLILCHTIVADLLLDLFPDSWFVSSKAPATPAAPAASDATKKGSPTSPTGPAAKKTESSEKPGHSHTLECCHGHGHGGHGHSHGPAAGEAAAAKSGGSGGTESSQRSGKFGKFRR